MSSRSGPPSSPRYITSTTATTQWRDLETDRGIQALEGKDVKALLSNVGSGGGGPATAAAGGATTGGDTTEAPKEEEKEEGRQSSSPTTRYMVLTPRREGGVRRRHGLRSIRLSGDGSLPFCTSTAWLGGHGRSIKDGGAISCCLDGVASLIFYDNMTECAPPWSSWGKEIRAFESELVAAA